jgi:hypothetical protein
MNNICPDGIRSRGETGTAATVPAFEAVSTWKRSDRADCTAKACGMRSLPAHLLAHLEILAMRYSHLGFTPDLASMTATELLALYCWLLNLGMR